MARTRMTARRQKRPEARLAEEPEDHDGTAYMADLYDEKMDDKSLRPHERSNIIDSLPSDPELGPSHYPRNHFTGTVRMSDLNIPKMIQLAVAALGIKPASLPHMIKDIIAAEAKDDLLRGYISCDTDAMDVDHVAPIMDAMDWQSETILMRRADCVVHASETYKRDSELDMLQHILKRNLKPGQMLRLQASCEVYEKQWQASNSQQLASRIVLRTAEVPAVGDANETARTEVLAISPIPSMLKGGGAPAQEYREIRALGFDSLRTPGSYLEGLVRLLNSHSDHSQYSVEVEILLGLPASKQGVEEDAKPAEDADPPVSPRSSPSGIPTDRKRAEAEIGCQCDLDIIYRFTIYTSADRITRPIARKEHLDLHRYVLHRCFEPSRPWQAEDGWGSTSLQQFNSTLRPAGSYPARLEPLLEPRGLVSSLKPFQKNTLAFLLKMEHAVDLDPWFATPNVCDPDGLWERLRIGSAEKGFHVAFARSTGDVRSIPPDVEADYQRRLKDGNKEEREALGTGPWLRMKNGFTTNRGRGVMLCEEMGMGKTVEAIALMLAHPRTGPFATSHDRESEMTVTEVSANLVVTPPSLLGQWQREMTKHAPFLRVMIYEGWKKHYARLFNKSAPKKVTGKRARGTESVSDPDETSDYDSSEAVQRVLEEFVLEVQQHDVVLTTFNAVATDFVVSTAAPQRARRSTVNYNLQARPRSLLQAAQWARIIMDESQMATPTQAVTLARIPREVSIAMSGTPARAEVKDLASTFEFIKLRLPSNLWASLQKEAYLPALSSLMSTCLVRTLKRDIGDESGLLRQRRYLVPFKLDRIEKDYYLDCLERGMAVMLDETGELKKNCDPEVVRALVHDLREICLHIQVGSMGKKKGSGKRRVNFGSRLLTLQEASSVMYQEARTQMWSLDRDHIESRIKKALLTQHQESATGARAAQLVLAEAQFKDIRAQLNVGIKAVMDAIKVDEPVGRDDASDLLSDTASSSTDAGLDEEMLELSRKREEQSFRKHTLQAQLRAYRMLLHQVMYRTGDLYYNMRQSADEPHPLETAAYESAAALRTTLLRSMLAAVDDAAIRVNEAVGVTGINTFAKLEIEELTLCGIRTKTLAEEANRTIEALNLNLAERIWPFRGAIAQLLSSAVTPQDESGEDYEAGLETAVKLQSYLSAYSDALVDHKDMLDIDREVLASRHAAQEARRKHDADRAKRLKLKRDIIPFPVKDVAGLAHEKNSRSNDGFERMVETHQESTVLPAKVIVQQAFSESKSLKHYQVRLVEIRNDFIMREEELAIVNSLFDDIKKIRADQKAVIALFEKEVEVFRRGINARTLYLKALQAISDSVIIFEDPWDEAEREDAQALAKSVATAVEVGDEAAEPEPEAKRELSPATLRDKTLWRAEQLQKATTAAQDAQLNLMRSAGRLRYLESMNEKEAGEDDICIVCREEFGETDTMEGMLLACGHSFCISCFGALRRAGQTQCIICRAVISINTTRKVAYRSKELDSTGPVAHADQGKAGQRVPANQAVLDPDLFHVMTVPPELLDIDVFGEYGTKIDLLVRHLLYIRQQDRSIRHLVFCSWSDGLAIVQQALASNGIKSISFDQRKAAEQFQSDNTIAVFLLHSERQSAGLTLTAASAVHMMNPMLGQSFELQAIGRVDRIGQTKQTTVYCYAAEDTVETKIIHRDLRRGLSIYARVEGMDPMDQIQGQVKTAKKGADDLSGTVQELLDLLLD